METLNLALEKLDDIQDAPRITKDKKYYQDDLTKAQEAVASQILKQKLNKIIVFSIPVEYYSPDVRKEIIQPIFEKFKNKANIFCLHPMVHIDVDNITNEIYEYNRIDSGADLSSWSSETTMYVIEFTDKAQLIFRDKCGRKAWPYIDMFRDDMFKQFYARMTY